jgi:hypothetical protein
MTIIRSLDSNNDWNFGRSKQDYLNGRDAVGLDVKTALKEQLNDCFFNLPAGVDYYNRLERKQKNNLDEEIRTVILKRPDVVGLLDFDSQLSITRNYTAQAEIRSIFGEIYLSELEGLT